MLPACVSSSSDPSRCSVPRQATSPVTVSKRARLTSTPSTTMLPLTDSAATSSPAPEIRIPPLAVLARIHGLRASRATSPSIVTTLSSRITPPTATAPAVEATSTMPVTPSTSTRPSAVITQSRAPAGSHTSTVPSEAGAPGGVSRPSFTPLRPPPMKKRPPPSTARTMMESRFQPWMVTGPVML